jgi:hypothetical protein
MGTQADEDRTYTERDLKMAVGVIALSPRKISHQTYTAERTPANTKLCRIKSIIARNRIWGTHDNDGLVVPWLGIPSPLKSKHQGRYSTGDKGRADKIEVEDLRENVPERALVGI